jgi:hypothetical protein
MGFYKEQSYGNGKKRSSHFSKNSLPFELSLDSISETDKFARRQDTEALRKFNDDVKAWAIHTTARLKANARMRVVRNLLLSDSIRPNLYYDKQYAKEVNRIGFSFVREGVYVEKGAGRGYGGYSGGSSWYNRKGQLKETSESSLMKMGTGRRRANPWFNPVIAQELPYLADIVGEYSATLQINATNIFID